MTLQSAKRAAAERRPSSLNLSDAEMGKRPQEELSPVWLAGRSMLQPLEVGELKRGHKLHENQPGQLLLKELARASLDAVRVDPPEASVRYAAHA
ncbi:hypothetical protein Rhopal_004678-T1 [Rhodotorula paludigena]|uniref:Uncharacterized protein n=1 Tax=Rhodotorula paludigena TaxID=86838 RepID=A0AAV5GGG8_9BASI|nr:hypothetical protein Rhopal_004678-T1 [Rhodotorula paludigena]